jgi:hypothetical protein
MPVNREAQTVARIALDRMLDRIARTVEQVQDRPRRKPAKRQKSESLCAAVEYEAKTA